MASFWQDLGIAELILSDIETVATGGSVSGTQTVAGIKLNVSVSKLASGPVPPYQVLTGSFWQIIGLVFADIAGFQAGVPISVADKIGNTWYGIALSLAT